MFFFILLRIFFKNEELEEYVLEKLMKFGISREIVKESIEKKKFDFPFAWLFYIYNLK